MIKIWVPHLREAAKGKPNGYFEEVTTAGKIDGDILYLEKEIYIKLRQKYSQHPKPDIFGNIAGAAVRVIKAATQGEKIRVSDAELMRRMDICHACEHYDGKKCCLCGCYARLKARLETEHCPINKW